MWARKDMVSHVTLSSVIHNPITSSIRLQASQSQITRRERVEVIARKRARLGGEKETFNGNRS